MRQIIALCALTMLAACGDDAYQKAEDDAAQSTAELASVTTAARNLRPEVSPASVLSDADKGRVCRAAIASLNGRDPAIIRVISVKDGIHRVRYTRDDGTVWTNECRVGDGTAEWRMVENGQPGRWRTEDTIRFTVNGPTISINTFMDGEAMSSDTYEVG